MKWLFLIMAISMVCCGNAATTWYVTKSGKDTNSGKSESAAFLTIQKAIDSAAKGDIILVSEGTYDYISVPAAKDALVIRAVGTVTKSVIKGNSGHRCVTVGAGKTKNVVVAGFTLTGASLSGENYGAGISGGTCSNCVVRGNTASVRAGGAYDCILINSEVSDNVARYSVGGIYKCQGVGCVIKGNTSTRYDQGGVTESELTDCIVESNVGEMGGGVASSQLTRCVIRNNVRKTSGGGSSSQGFGVHSCTCTDCLICGNRGPDGGAVSGSSKLYNCTVVDNAAGRADSSSGYTDVIRGGTFYNCIFGGRSTNSNSNTVFGATFNKCLLWNAQIHNATQNKSTNANPEFAGVGDYRLKSTSPCINAGDNTYVKSSVDILGNPRVVGGAVDLGAYEWQSAPAEVKNVIANSRYPWNGKVDLKFTIDGTSGTKYNTSFTARDVVGNTNLTMKTIYKSNGTAVNVSKEQLTPGTYNWVWNAAADLGVDAVLDRVVVEVKAE